MGEARIVDDVIVPSICVLPVNVVRVEEPPTAVGRETVWVCTSLALRDK